MEFEESGVLTLEHVKALDTKAFIDNITAISEKGNLFERRRAQSHGPLLYERGSRLPEMKNWSCADCRCPCALADLDLAHVWHDFIRPVSFIPRQMIFEQGESHTGCYLVCDGWILLRVRTATGRQIGVGIAGSGELVGVGSFLGQPTHELSAQALTDVRARYLTCSACESLLREPSILTSRLLQALASQFRWLRRQAQFFASGASVRERLAALLLTLAQRYGTTPEARAKRIEPPLSGKLLAQMLDSHRGTVSEELTELRQRGLITCQEGRIVILDETGLQKLAENVF